MKIVKKISTKSVCGKISGHDLISGEDRKLFDVIGFITTLKSMEGDYGRSICFNGSFEATNRITGEVFRGGSLYLPKCLETILEGTFLQGNDVESGHPFMLNIGVVIGITKDDSPIGYTYTVETMGKQSADPFATVRESLGLPQKTHENQAVLEVIEPIEVLQIEVNHGGTTEPMKKPSKPSKPK